MGKMKRQRPPRRRQKGKQRVERRSEPNHHLRTSFPNDTARKDIRSCNRSVNMMSFLAHSSSSLCKILVENEWLDVAGIGNLLQTCKATRDSLDNEEIFRLIATQYQPFAPYHLKAVESSTGVASELVRRVRKIIPGWCGSLPAYRANMKSLKKTYSTSGGHNALRNAFFDKTPRVVHVPRELVRVSPFIYNGSWKELVMDGNARNQVVAKESGKQLMWRGHVCSCPRIMWDKYGEKILILLRSPWTKGDSSFLKATNEDWAHNLDCRNFDVSERDLDFFLDIKTIKEPIVTIVSPVVLKRTPRKLLRDVGLDENFDYAMLSLSTSTLPEKGLEALRTLLFLPPRFFFLFRTKERDYGVGKNLITGVMYFHVVFDALFTKMENSNSHVVSKKELNNVLENYFYWRNSICETFVVSRELIL